ncbi:MAG TPA: hypothetical protein VKQ52_18730, partial [Puia sp.]|nr:hypothetical protein [Puia sp.]
KELYPELKCTIIFQPHLFTRTRDFADGFAASLDRADEVILLPIYPAREQPIAGVTSELIAGKMKKAKITIADKKEVLAMIKETAERRDQAQLLITAGAGDIDMLIEPLRQLLESPL